MAHIPKSPLFPFYFRVWGFTGQYTSVVRSDPLPCCIPSQPQSLHYGTVGVRAGLDAGQAPAGHSSKYCCVTKCCVTNSVLVTHLKHSTTQAAMKKIVFQHLQHLKSIPSHNKTFLGQWDHFNTSKPHRKLIISILLLLASLAAAALSQAGSLITSLPSCPHPWLHLRERPDQAVGLLTWQVWEGSRKQPTSSHPPAQVATDNTMLPS